MIELKNIKKVYQENSPGECLALNNINLNIERGSMIAITGKSGSGKSTLLHILACIDNCTSGEYKYNGRNISNLSNNEKSELRNHEIGIVIQDFALVEEFSTIENVMIPLTFSKVKNRKTIALDALKKIGINDLENKKVCNLSGGQKQRVAIARAVVNNPSLILADEPTGALDTKTSADIMALFHRLHSEGKTIIIVTHDIEIANQCNKIIEISDGSIL